MNARQRRAFVRERQRYAEQVAAYLAALPNMTRTLNRLAADLAKVRLPNIAETLRQLPRVPIRPSSNTAVEKD